MEKQTFVETIKGKIIIVFTLIFISLGIMWGVNRIAFDRITSIVNELAKPNEKLVISRQLFIHVSNLPHLQQAEILKGKGKLSSAFLNNNDEIRKDINALRQFFL